MEKMLSFLIVMVAVLGLAMTAPAMDQCEVVGNSYTLDLNGESWTLTDFEIQLCFSPAPFCSGTVNLVSPTGDSQSVDWSVNYHRTALMIAGLPAILTQDGLIVYALPAELNTLKIGDTMYMTEGEIPTFNFK